MTRVAIHGIRGSYGELAASEMLDGCEILERGGFESACDAARRGIAEFAVLPTRNKIVGEIRTVSEAVEKHGLRMLDDHLVKVDHVLAGVPGCSLEGLREVVSHPEALRQCGRFLRRHSKMRAVSGGDTASSLRDVVASGDTARAAIASRRAAGIYDAAILCDDVADEAENWTVFGLFSL